MNKILLYALSTAIVALSSFLSASAQSGLGLDIGFSTPIDKINNVYNSSTFGLNNQNYIMNAWEHGSDLGWHIGLLYRLPMSENTTLHAGIAWHKIPQSKTVVLFPAAGGGQGSATVVTNQNLYPITAGIDYFLFRSILSPYATGELSYNYISNSVQIEGQSSIPNFSGAQSVSRVGFGLGAGIDIDLKLVNMNFIAKYNMANLIGQEANEKTESYVTLSLVVFFGGLLPI